MTMTHNPPPQVPITKVYSKYLVGLAPIFPLPDIVLALMFGAPKTITGEGSNAI